MHDINSNPKSAQPIFYPHNPYAAFTHLCDFRSQCSIVKFLNVISPIFSGSLTIVTGFNARIFTPLIKLDRGSSVTSPYPMRVLFMSRNRDNPISRLEKNPVPG